MSQNFIQAVCAEFFAAIDHCVDQRLRIPALILVYSLIDLLAWFSSDSASVRARFTDWVDKYLLPNSSLQSTSLDVYAARCGVVHSSSSTSDLSRARKAKQIFYAWAPSGSETLNELIGMRMELNKHLGFKSEPEIIAVQGEELIDALRKGVGAFFAELANDETKAKEIFAKASLSFADFSDETVLDLINRAKEALSSR